MKSIKTIHWISALLLFLVIGVLGIHWVLAQEPEPNIPEPVEQPRIQELSNKADLKALITRDQSIERIKIPEGYSGTITIAAKGKEPAVEVDSKNVHLKVDSGTLKFENGVPIFGQNLQVAKGSTIPLGKEGSDPISIEGTIEKLALLPQLSSHTDVESGIETKQLSEVYFAYAPQGLKIADATVAGNIIAEFGNDINLYSKAATIMEGDDPIAVFAASGIPLPMQMTRWLSGDLQNPPLLCLLISHGLMIPGSLLRFSWERPCLDPLDFPLIFPCKPLGLEPSIHLWRSIGPRACCRPVVFLS